MGADLTSLRFLADGLQRARDGTGRSGKDLPGQRIRVIAARRHQSVHTERADKLFKRLRGARLDGTYDDEMRKLHRVELLIIDDLALHRLEATETTDFYWQSPKTPPRNAPPGLTLAPGLSPGKSQQSRASVTPLHQPQRNSLPTRWTPLRQRADDVIAGGSTAALRPGGLPSIHRT